MKDTVKLAGRRARLIAHRGLSGLEAENTCAAFVAAANRSSYYGIETDVHRTADGHFVILHDDTAERTGDRPLNAEASDFRSLCTVHLKDTDGTYGRRDLVIPTLEEYIGICRRYGKECVLELKNAFTPEDIGRICRLYEQMGYADHVIYISFVLDNLKTLRSMKPEARLQLLVEKDIPENLAETLEQYRLDLDADHTLLTRRLCEDVHAAGQAVNCWTVNDPADAEAMLELNVDYITTNILE